MQTTTLHVFMKKSITEIDPPQKEIRSIKEIQAINELLSRWQSFQGCFLRDL